MRAAEAASEAAADVSEAAADAEPEAAPGAAAGPAADDMFDEAWSSASAESGEPTMDLAAAAETVRVAARQVRTLERSALEQAAEARSAPDVYSLGKTIARLDAAIKMLEAAEELYAEHRDHADGRMSKEKLEKFEFCKALCNSLDEAEFVAFRFSRSKRVLRTINLGSGDTLLAFMRALSSAPYTRLDGITASGNVYVLHGFNEVAGIKGTGQTVVKLKIGAFHAARAAVVKAGGRSV